MKPLSIKTDIKNPSKMQLPGLNGLNFSSESIINARNAGQIQCLRLDLSYRCNINCSYCYTKYLFVKEKKEHSFEEIVNTIEQGIQLGIESVVLLGGEPLIYDRVYDILDYLHKQNIIPIIFTNGIGLTDDIVSYLYRINATVLIKNDGSQKLQDELCGNGVGIKIRQGFQKLLNYGFNTTLNGNLRMGCATVVTNKNYSLMPELWRYLRDNCIYPHVERMTVFDVKLNELSISHEQSLELNKIFMKIDEDEYGIVWDTPYPALCGFKCSILFNGCHCNPYREVSICPEIKAEFNLYEQSLSEILCSEYFRKTRHIELHIKGHCKNCTHLVKAPCYGCRSKVLKKTNDLFAEDSDCPLIGNIK